MVARTDAAQHSLMAQLKARRVKKTYLALVLGEVAAAVGRIEAPIGRDPKHRTRMARRRRRPAVDDRLPGPRAVRRLDAPRARPRDRPDPPDPGPSRRDRPPDRGRPGLRDGDVAAGPATRPGRRPLERLFLHAWRLELTSPIERLADPGRGAAPRRAGAGPRRAPRPARLRPEAADDATDRSPRPPDLGATASLGRSGRPSTRSTARRGRCWSSSRGRPAWARTRSSTRCAGASADDGPRRTSATTS